MSKISPAVDVVESLDVNGHLPFDALSTSAIDPANNNSFSIERILAYQLKDSLFIVGSSSCQSQHRVLRFDRRCLKESLSIEADERVLNTNELNCLRRREHFDGASRGTIEATAVGFGIVGLVRFLEGYYLILITKRRCVAVIGRHSVYKIEETTMLYIPNVRPSNGDEQRYLAIFKSMDLRNNFYFSYSYDLSNTLQCNLSSYTPSTLAHFPSYGVGTSATIWDTSEPFLASFKAQPYDESTCTLDPRLRFTWNESLLRPLAGRVSNDFFLYLVHGLVKQVSLPLADRSLALTLVARRSARYAGPRYLKRGVNCEGFPANEVETEQILADTEKTTSFADGLYSSYVQMRGSVPTYWSQNVGKLRSPKPPITVDMKDPFCQAPAKHFNRLLTDYGSPIIALNLVKRKEKRPQETILYREFESTIAYLNQFLPPAHQILHLGFDMARAKKTAGESVMTCLADISLFALKKTGFFLSQQTRSVLSNPNLAWLRSDGAQPAGDRLIFQRGLPRVNCVDCLDRTNTAQFTIGRTALIYQLLAMGAIAEPGLPLGLNESLDALYEALFEEHGHTMALQYGGSQLVHRIKSYREREQELGAKSKDKLQSITRFYSNAFSDADKQNAINLFLGVYKPAVHGGVPLWDLPNDYALHHAFLSDLKARVAARCKSRSTGRRIGLTKWWTDEVARCLPRAAREFTKQERRCSSVFWRQFGDYNWFSSVHRVQEFTLLTELFLYQKKDTEKSPGPGPGAKKTSCLGNNAEESDDEEDDDSDDQLSHDEDTSVVIRLQRDRQAVSCVIRHQVASGEGDIGDKILTKERAPSKKKKRLAKLPKVKPESVQQYRQWMRLSSVDHFLDQSAQERLRKVYGKAYQMKKTAQSKPQLAYGEYVKIEGKSGAVTGESMQMYSEYLSKD